MLREKGSWPVALVAAALVTGTGVAALVYRAESGSAASRAAAPRQPVPPQAGEGVGDPLPGALPFPPELNARLRAKWTNRDPAYL